MATFKKTLTGKWQAQIAIQGHRKAKSFPTKAAARDWANRQEYLIREGESGGSASPFREILDRYAREVSTTKRGAKWEIVRLDKIGRGKIGDKRLRDLGVDDFIAWRDHRLTEVAPASVNREMVLLSAVMTHARKEWRLIKVNPLSDVTKPRQPPPRDRRVSDAEVEALVHAGGGDLSTKIGRAVHAFRFAVETAMRAGEIVSLRWDRIDLDVNVAHLPMTKNGQARDVPLSPMAADLLRELPKLDPCFGLASADLDVLFRRARDRTDIEGLRFHDSRHEAITRLAKRVEVLDLARIVGHRDINMLLVYYNATASELADRLR